MGMSDRDLVRMVEDDREADVLREDLERASAHSTEYDVAAGVAAFEASLASAPPPAAESASVTSATTAGTGAGKIVMMVLGVVAVAGVAGVALSGSGDRAQSDTPTAVAAESPERGSPDLESPSPELAKPEARKPDSSAEAPQPAAVALPLEDSSADLAAVPELPEVSEDTPAKVSARRRPAAQASKPSVPAPGVDGLKAEMAATDRARKALAGNPGRALTLARDANAEFPHGLFAEQRAGIEALALIALGKDTAQRTAEQYLRNYPKGTYADRLRDALADNP